MSSAGFRNYPAKINGKIVWLTRDEYERCESCDGVGMVEGYTCEECDGSGKSAAVGEE